MIWDTSVEEQVDEDFGMFGEASLRGRWEWVVRAFVRFEELQPVRLCGICDRYFVEDGNHRVPVAATGGWR